MPSTNISSADVSSASRPRALRLDRRDNVLVAVTDLPAASEVDGVVCLDSVPAGHKVASAPILAGEPIRKFGQIIGFAEREIRAGQHVHEHNCVYGEFSRDAEVGVDYRPTDFVSEAERATFQGIVREDGRVATRNMIGVVTTVNCSATVARAIVDRLRQQALRDYPNVDDIVAFTHSGGVAPPRPVKTSKCCSARSAVSCGIRTWRVCCCSGWGAKPIRVRPCSTAPGCSRATLCAT